MPTIDTRSTIYRILSGEHMGRLCSIYGEDDPSSEIITVVFTDFDCNKTEVVRKSHLSKLKNPGWTYDRSHPKPYGLDAYMNIHKGNGSNMLKTPSAAQPRALRKGDRLASGETVTEKIRMGYNSSVLVHLSKSGWVELASRLPIALKGNKSFKMPFEVNKRDVLLTGCAVSKDPDSKDAGWTNIYLDKQHLNIKTPSCVPLALANSKK